MTDPRAAALAEALRSLYTAGNYLGHRAEIEATAHKLEMFAAARQRDADANRDAPDNINEAMAAACRGWAAALRAALEGASDD